MHPIDKRAKYRLAARGPVRADIYPKFLWSMLAGAVLASLLVGCGDRLVMVERTGFNLGVSVNQDGATPINVNAGLQRKILGIVPARQERRNELGESVPEDEAVSLFSGFDLTYARPETGQLGGDLTIRTQFASGEAAVTLAKGTNPAAVSAFVDVKGVSPQSQSAPSAAAQRIETLESATVVPKPDPVPTSLPGALNVVERSMIKEDLLRVQHALCFKKEALAGADTATAFPEFGPKTREAIRSYHARARETDSNQIDLEMLEDLDNKGRCPFPLASYFERSLYDSSLVGAEGKKGIILLQKQLKTVTKDPELKEDGQFGERTRRAIRKVQEESENLDVTGIVDFAFLLQLDLLVDEAKRPDGSVGTGDDSGDVTSAEGEGSEDTTPVGDQDPP